MKAAKTAARKYANSTNTGHQRQDGVMYDSFLAGVDWVSPLYQELLEAAKAVSEGSKSLPEVRTNFERLRKAISKLT